MLTLDLDSKNAEMVTLMLMKGKVDDDKKGYHRKFAHHIIEDYSVMITIPL